ncbi:MAG: cytochrome b/b6 domain-containing protein, partial [Syntrophaceae bacterium]|nr:cytochrome b/b6 domain-containing protein [Syntrophaceae bacterium]
MTDRIIEEKGVVVRHGVIELLEHWLLAISGIVLIVSGLFPMPLPRRYYITDLPGMAWSGDFMLTLKIHYIASIVFIAVSLFHVVYHGMLRHNAMLPKKGDVKESIDVIKTFFGKGEEPPFHKYLPEQRIAYVGMAVIIAVLIISGIAKTYKNVYAPQMTFALVSWATWLHNIFAVLFILAFIAHVAAILLKPNLP